MRYFTNEALRDLHREFRAIPQKLDAIQQLYLVKEFQQQRAKEFAQHGFLRRIRILSRCIENVFSLIPPERIEPVEREIRADTEINIQTSVFNVFAAADNLAWIWIIEKNVRSPDGSELPDAWVGLRRSNRIVRASLTPELRAHAEGLDAWFDMVDNYRHALAHRIPLYIPPYIVNRDDGARYRDLEQRKMHALLAGDLGEHRRVVQAQRELEIFRPWMQHSFGEGARPLVFHPQLLANFNTIEELGRKFLAAL